MKKDFKQELTELINKHSLEKEMRDTPDYILAEICIDAMAVFTEAIAAVDRTVCTGLERNFAGTDSERQTKRVRRMQNTITRMITIFAKTVLNVLTL
jgi:hypothetical protein